MIDIYNLLQNILDQVLKRSMRSLIFFNSNFTNNHNNALNITYSFHIYFKLGPPRTIRFRSQTRRCPRYQRR